MSLVAARKEKKFYDRLAIDQIYEKFVGGKIPKWTIPVRKNKKLIIIETAALKYNIILYNFYININNIKYQA